MRPLYKNSFFVLLETITMIHGGPLPPEKYLWYAIVPKFGPYDIKEGYEGNVFIEYRFHYDLTGLIQAICKIENTKGRTLEIFEGSIVENSNGEEWYTAWNIPLYKYLTKNGLIIHFDAKPLDTTRKVEDSNCDLMIYPRNIDTFNPFAGKNKIYRSKPIACEYQVRDPITYICEYDFSGLVDACDGEDNRYLHYPICSFTYRSFNPFTYKEAYIRFFDKKNLFPYYDTSEDGYKHIPLRLIYDEETDTVEVRIQHTFWINTSTMQISNKYRKDFEMTGFFTFPRNFEYYADQYNFEIEMIDLGDDMLDVKYPISLKNDKNFFGLCKDSENCVVGGVVE